MKHSGPEVMERREGVGSARAAAVSEREANPSRRLRLWMAGTLLLCFLYFLPRTGDWNQDSRLDLTLAMVNHRTIAVDGYQWNAGVDVTYVRGHYYANKAPGQSLAGIPILLAYKGLLSAAGHASDAQRIGVGRYWKKLYFNFFLLQCLESIYSVSIPAMLFLMLFFTFLGFFTSSTASRVGLTLALGLATDVFSYSQVFYPHVPTGALLFGAFMLLYIAGSAEAQERSRRLRGRPALTASLAGLCLGGAFLLDHTSALPGGIVGVYGLTRLPKRVWLYLALGAVPAFAATLGFDYLSFHSAAVTGYNARGTGVGGIDAGVAGAPSGHGFWGMSFSPYRGLFFLSPFLLLAFPGAWLWRKRGGLEWMVCLGAPAAYFVLISAISFWYGGASVGPRYLVPVVPFLALPIIFVLDAVHRSRLRFGVYALMVLSGVNVWLQTVAARGFPPVSVQNPLFDYALPSLAHGRVTLSLGSVLVAPFTGINSQWTLAPLIVLLGLWSLWCGHGRNKVSDAEPMVRTAGETDVVLG
jgi:hypothetical protein